MDSIKVFANGTSMFNFTILSERIVNGHWHDIVFSISGAVLFISIQIFNIFFVSASEMWICHYFFSKTEQQKGHSVESEEECATHHWADDRKLSKIWKKEMGKFIFWCVVDIKGNIAKSINFTARN